MRKIFTVAAVFFCSPLLAQDSTFISDLQHPMDNVVITTNKYPKKQSQTGKVVSVIDKKMLEQMGGRTVSEIVNTVACVTINGANNNLGTNQRASIRGSSDGNVLILVDGIPVNDPSVLTNYFDLNFFHTSQIERIEVLKGGQSTMYGSDAVAGVINIITKKPATKKMAPYFSASAGSYGTFQGSAGLTGLHKKIHYNAAFTQMRSKGYSAAYDKTGAGGFDKDGYGQSIARAGLGIDLSVKFKWSLSASYSRYKADLDYGAFTDEQDYSTKSRNLQLVSGFSWSHGKGNLKLNYQFNYVERFYLDDSLQRNPSAYFSRSNYIGRSHFAEIYDNLKWDRFSLLAGIDYRVYNTSQEYLSISQFGPYQTKLEDTAQMWQVSPYASLVYNYADLNIELGGRWNRHNEYGNNYTYTFNPSYLLKKKLKVFANLSSAFKVPSLYQLYDPYIGNTMLQPEKSLILEGGLEWYANKIFVRATPFYRKTKNAIQFAITDPVFFAGHYQNVTSQENYGSELEFRYRSDKWDISSNYTFTKGKTNSAYSPDGDPLPKSDSYNSLFRVPEHAFNLFATRQLGRQFSLSSLFRFVDERLEPVFGASPLVLNSYATIDLSFHYRPNEKLRLFLDLRNLTNERYFDIAGYNSRRFNMSAGVNVQL